MRVLLDACMPQGLRHDVSGHDVQTARFAGLADLDDGDLLDAIAGRFDALVTADKNMPRQNVIAGRPFSVVVVRTHHNLLDELKPLVPRIQQALLSAKAGEVVEIR